MLRFFSLAQEQQGTNELDKSDIDISLLGNKKISNIIISKLYEELEESVVPYHIDIVDFFNVDSDFRKLTTQNKIVWKKKKNIDKIIKSLSE